MSDGKLKKRGDPSYFDGKWDWDFLVSARCFGASNISPSDIDGAIHVGSKCRDNDHILLLETKRPGESLPDAQKLMLEGFVKIGKGRITLVIVRGECCIGNSSNSTIERFTVYEYDKTRKLLFKTQRGEGIKSFMDFVDCWYSNVRRKQELRQRREKELILML